MLTKSDNEYSWVSEKMMPFLRENWDLIDLADPSTGYCDGRLTRAELLVAYATAIETADETSADTIAEILSRYDTICQAYEDGYWYGEEAELGISENDVSVYQQLVDPSRSDQVAEPQPQYWY